MKIEVNCVVSNKSKSNNSSRVCIKQENFIKPNNFFVYLEVHPTQLTKIQIGKKVKVTFEIEDS